MIQSSPMAPTYDLFGPSVPIALSATLVAATAIFRTLAVNWTTKRRWFTLVHWAAINRRSLLTANQARIPDALNAIRWQPAKPLLSLTDDNSTILQVEAAPIPAKPSSPSRMRWNLLVRQIESSWPVVGLRPTRHLNSILDYLAPSSIQTMAPGERFVVHATHPAAARALARSSARAILPHDVGLMLINKTLILDFSTRPFDPLEFHRVNALADQLLAHLRPLPTQNIP